MKLVQFTKNGYKTKMNDRLAAIYEGKKKVKILKDIKEDPAKDNRTGGEK